MKSSAKKTIKLLLLISLLLLLCAALLFLGLSFPKKYGAAVHSYAREFHLEEELVYAVIKAESGFSESAVSHAGAVGLMQIMPSTAEFICRRYRESLDISVPEQNIRLGCMYLSYLFEKFEKEELVLAAYNAGEGTVRSWIERGLIGADGHYEMLPFAETHDYVRKVKFFEKCYRIFR